MGKRALRVGTPGRIRTCDPRLRRPMLYPAELRARALESTTYGNPLNTASRFCQPNRLRTPGARSARSKRFDRGCMPRQLRRSMDDRRPTVRVSVQILDVRHVRSRLPNPSQPSWRILRPEPSPEGTADERKALSCTAPASDLSQRVGRAWALQPEPSRYRDRPRGCPAPSAYGPAATPPAVRQDRGSKGRGVGEA